MTHIRDTKTHLAPPSLHDATPLGKSPTLITTHGEAIIDTSAIIGEMTLTGSGSMSWSLSISLKRT